jgi:serine/threonine protein kinase
MADACPDMIALERAVATTEDDPSSAFVFDHAANCGHCSVLLADIRDNLSMMSPVRDALRRMDDLDEKPAEAPPRSVGAYRVIREIGRGGMGVVYAAEQDQPRRGVAVKVLHAGVDHDGRIERLFRREADALARLRHPGIAAIHSAGRADDGRAFLAMELVHGESLIRFAQSRNLSRPARLELFRRVCEAAAYAHQRGVIHRDLKPANILVEDASDGPPTPRILDFGLAKLLDADDGASSAAIDNSFVTEAGRIQGTLPYMSPEQVRGDPLELDIRTDVYSLGVILYELLTGRLPYIVRRGQLSEAARIICDQPPARPSTIDRALRGDVETIILKALEKSPARRYSSASALAEDIARLLADQPILARPPTPGYHLAKLIRRHRAASMLVGALAATVIGFAGAMTWLFVEARDNLHRAEQAETTAGQEADRARREAATARRVSDLMIDIFKVSNPDVSRGESVTARRLLDNAAQRVERELVDEPLVLVRLLNAIGHSYDSLGLLEEAGTCFKRGIALLERHAPRSLDLAELSLSAASIARRLGRADEFRPALDTALSIMRDHRGDDDGHILVLLRELGDQMLQQGESADALPLIEEVVRQLRDNPMGDEGLVAALNTQAGVLCTLGRVDEAVPLMREAHALLSAATPRGSLALARVRANLGWLLVLSGEFDEAETLVRQAHEFRQAVLPPGHPDFASSSLSLGVIAMERGDPATAEPLLRAAVTIRERYKPDDDADLAESRALLGVCLCRLDRRAEGESLLRDGCDSLLRRPEPLLPILVHAIRQAAEEADRAGHVESAAAWRGVLDDAAARPAHETSD